MTESSPPRSRIMYCIATDSLYSQKKATVAAQLAVKDELQGLFDTDPPISAFLTTSPSPIRTSIESCGISSWYSTGCPKQATVAMRNCELWILFTDGEQEQKHEETHYDTFDLRVAQLKVTEYPCVFILFGSCAAGPPSASRYHVCQETLTKTQDALLLFHDVDTEQAYVLEAKGCFYPLKGDITIGEGADEWSRSKWSTLRRLRYKELLNIELPLAYPLDLENQLIVYDGLVLSNKQLDARKAETDTGDRFDMQRLQEIIKKAAEKDTFSPRYSVPSLPANQISRVDVDGEANHAIHMLFMNFDHRDMGIPVPESRIDEYRSDLRAANKANRLAFEQAISNKKREALDKQQRERKSFLLPATDPQEIFFPGFVRAPSTNRKHSEFRGQCMLCYEEDTILVLLMHDADLVNADHLTHMFIPYVVHNMLVCDTCAIHIPSENNHLERKIVAFLPLVSVIDNEAAWTQAFRKVVGPDIHEDEILILVWKWLSTQLVYDVGKLQDGVFKEAMLWVMRDLGKWEDTTRTRRYDTKSICY